ncbi:MAG: hypothetical protein ACI3ZV_01280 [Paludibacteraceae bacterium]|nr:hypothetical protein [Paludibacteraceae bacterium]
MIKKITPSKSHISTQKNLQPRPQTLHTILAFAAAYHAEILADGTLLQSILN